MSNFYTSDELIKSIKRRALIPANQSTFVDTDFLAFADEEMNIGLMPSVLSMHEDYYLYTEDIPLISNQSKYPIPYRATGNKLREVAFSDQANTISEMTRIGIGDLPFYNTSSGVNRTYAYYIANNEICLVPESTVISTGATLRVSFYLRPNSLVLLKDVATITSIDRTTGMIQVSNLPTTFNINNLVDLVQYRSPHKILKYDIQVVSINTISKTITLDPNDIPQYLAVNDQICLAQQSAIPQLPSDLHVVLAHRAAARCLEALGDTEGLQNANQKLAEMEQKMMNLIDNRVEDAPQKIVNRRSILRDAVYSRRFRFRS